MERLQKVMANRGVASRRECEKLIRAGRVAVNGKIVCELGTKVSKDDVIEVDGRRIPAAKGLPIYVMLTNQRAVLPR